MTPEDFATKYEALGLFDTMDVYTKTDTVTRAKESDLEDQTQDVAYKVVRVPGGFLLQVLNIASRLTESSVFIPYELPEPPPEEEPEP